MGILRRGGIWWINYCVCGKQKFESTHSTSKRFAQKILAIRKAEIIEGRFGLPKSNSPTLHDWSESFLETIPHPNTKRTYKSCIESLRAFFDEKRLPQITAEQIEAFKETRRKSGVGPATINRNLAVLRRMLKLAVRQRYITRSPFHEVEFLEERSCRRQPHILTFEEQAKLLAVAPPRLRVLVVLLTETGLRVGKEALSLKWEDVDLKNDVIHVRQSKTHSGRRIVPLSSFCKAELEMWKNLAGPDFSEFVFPNVTNPRHPLQGGRKAWVSTLKKAGIPFFPIYNLRHTFASRLNAAGCSDTLLAQMLGHSSTSILQTYAKAIDEYRRDAIRKLELFRQNQAKEESIAQKSSMQSVPTI